MSNNSLTKGNYTRHSNKIGLTNKDGFITYQDNVVLNFPFKDTVLEAGMNKEDAARTERFLHLEVDGRDIDTLFEPKVLTSFQYFSQNNTISNQQSAISNQQSAISNQQSAISNQQSAISNQQSAISNQQSIEFFDENGELTQNLLIKGNNLLALHSLKSRLAGQIKLIYIDPPYYFNNNKPFDTFKYNSNFKLSSWLVFMKNRLEIAKELLADNGVILVHINEDGNAYLKILMNEVFGNENFVETYIWKNTDNPDSLSKKSRSSVEYIIAFEKRINKTIAYIGKETENGDAPLLHTGNNYKPLIFPAGSIKFKLADGKIEKGKPDRVEIVNDFDIVNGINAQEVILIGEFVWSQETVNEELKKGTYFLIKSNKFSIRFQRLEATSMAPEKYIDNIYLSKAIGVGTNEDATSHLNKLNIKFSNSKPESVVSFFLKAVTSENDIVLDFFAGSGTTCAVAHKMGRRWIGIEQMDYIDDITKVRLQKVIDGEQGGISKAVNWTGGGSFVYFELKKYNQYFIDKIQSAKTMGELDSVYDEMAKNAFFKFWFDKDDFQKQYKKDADDNKISLEDRKEILKEVLDENQLYLNYADMDDTRFKVSDDEKALSKAFYGA
ncbi:site-specific DNA-methyltransferase [Moraxella sp. RCAD0137]|uniref:site-specific DNA-methyltransferase n=1 Tax=Moraxella sp. RCAD0137 TaxID=1775913 RepID=UPI000C9F221B|nr:site-specific DNA-methyltransferase [Moraxella sp. RCAD0137]PNP97850.1 hypothetical protein AZ602_05890 [Moraxella sp. RCAD0137]